MTILQLQFIYGGFQRKMAAAKIFFTLLTTICDNIIIRARCPFSLAAWRGTWTLCYSRCCDPQSISDRLLVRRRRIPSSERDSRNASSGFSGSKKIVTIGVGKGKCRPDTLSDKSSNLNKHGNSLRNQSCNVQKESNLVACTLKHGSRCTLYSVTP